MPSQVTPLSMRVGAANKEKVGRNLVSATSEPHVRFPDMGCKKMWARWRVWGEKSPFSLHPKSRCPCSMKNRTKEEFASGKWKGGYSYVILRVLSCIYSSSHGDGEPVGKSCFCNLFKTPELKVEIPELKQARQAKSFLGSRRRSLSQGGNPLDAV